MAIEVRQKANDVIGDARQIYQDFSAQLNDAQRNAVGAFVPYSAWSASDVLGHITFWNDIGLVRLDAIRRGEPVPSFADFDPLNEAAYAKRQAWGWDRIWAETFDVVDRLAAHVNSLTDDQLVPAGEDKRAVWQRLEGDLLSHATLHLADYWFFQNDSERAEAIHKTYITISGRLGGSDSKGAAVYNLACYHAKMGAADKALPLLKESLMLRPDLTEWSRQDPDLLSLHQIPAYLALYPTTAPENS